MPIVLVVLKTVLVAPAVLVSVLLWLLVFAVLPSGMGILGFLVGVATWMLLVVGTSEQLAVRSWCGRVRPPPRNRSCLAD